MILLDTYFIKSSLSKLLFLIISKNNLNLYSMRACSRGTLFRGGLIRGFTVITKVSTINQRILSKTR